MKLGEEPIGQAFDRVLRLAERPNVALKWAHAPTIHNPVPSRGR